MRDIRLTKLPRHEGPVTVEYLELVLRDLIGKFDPRNPQNDFASSFVVANDGTATIGTGSKVISQRTLPTVNAGNRLSAQTTNPLSSFGSASTASIVIASHVVQYGGFTVSYNGGTISGLTPLTLYYVYADDPDLDGGAVAYSATTVPATVVSNTARYYVGQITTTNTAASGTITAASQANPCQITQVAHPFVTGDEVLITGIVGMTELNDGQYTITKTGPDTYTLDGIDSTGYTAYVSGGTATRIPPASSGGGGGGSGWAIP